MTFNNSKTITEIRIRLFAVTVLLLGYLILVYFAHILKFPILGMSETVITSILVCIYLLIAFYPMVLDFQYISYSDEGDMLVFRYFTTGFVGGTRHSVEIKKGDFAGYKVAKRLFGLRRSITLFHQMPQGVAMYPPIHISILSKKERGRILNSLYSYTPKDAEDAKE